MRTAAAPRKSTTPRPLVEWAAAAGDSTEPALKIDKDKQTIYGVRVLGRYSRNAHGQAGADNGTEYTLACMDDAVARGLYEGVEVLANHEQLSGQTQGLKQRKTERGVEYVVGVIHAPRREGDGIRGDLTYYTTHPMSARVVEDVEKRIGALGLSHDASAAKERFDRAAGRLVIEKLAAVNSVDLVRKPATNRNLWEGQQPMKKTLRQLLEALTLTPVRQAWRKRLLEDGDMADPMATEMEAPAGTDPDQALADGFRAAINAVLDAEDMDAAAKLAKIKTLLTTHEKLTAAEEPAEPVQEDEEKKKAAADKDKTEAVKENAKLKHKLAVRELCETLGVAADKVLLESLEAVPLATARKLAEREKARGGKPRSSGLGGGTGTGGGAGKKTGKDFLAAVTN